MVRTPPTFAKFDCLVLFDCILSIFSYYRHHHLKRKKKQLLCYLVQWNFKLASSIIHMLRILPFVNSSLLRHFLFRLCHTIVMPNNIAPVNETNLIERCAKILKENGVIAVPTDTIYGLAALVNSEQAVRRIYEIKGRSFTKPLAISVGTVDDIFSWSKPTLTKEQLGTGDLLPGPVTLMFERNSSLPSYFNPDVKNVAMRIPKSQFIIELAQYLQEPIALTSANISNEPSTLSINEFQILWPQVDLVVDGGLLASNDRRGSTIVDLSQPGIFQIQRHGLDCERIIEYLKSSCSLCEKTM